MSNAPDERTAEPGVYKRGNRYIVRFKDPQGRSRRRFARTIAEARDIKAGLRTDMARGEYRQRNRVTFEEYARDWIDTYTGRTTRGIRAETLAEYRRTIERGAIPFFGRMRLAEIEPRDVKRYAKQVSDRGVSVSTVRLALAPVRALFATALEEGVIRVNPTLGVRIPKPDRIEDDQVHPRALTEEELARLLSKINPQYQTLIELLAQTGLRISEALALRWSDVDLGQQRVHVRRRVSKTGGIAPPKSRYGRRTVPLSPGMARTLWTRRKTAEAAQDDDPVFANRRGDPLNRVNLFNRVLKPAARAAGVPWAGFHSLRHTTATLLFRHGMNAKQVQVWLGHHSPGFTMGTYVHLLPDDLPAPAFLDTLITPVGDTEGDTSPAETIRTAAAATGTKTA